MENLQVISTTEPNIRLRKVVEPYIININIDNNMYSITVPMNFTYDGASIPKLLWIFFGTPYSCKNDTPGCVHDWLYRKESDNKVKINGHYRTIDRYCSDNLFYYLLVKNNVFIPKAYLMYFGVRIGGYFYFKKR